MEEQNSPFYLGNYKEKPIVFQIKSSDKVITFELPWDVGMEDLCQAFYSACVGLTFHPQTVINGMLDFASEHNVFTNSTENNCEDYCGEVDREDDPF